MSCVQLKFENFSKTLLFEFLSYFAYSFFFKRAHETNIPSNYIYFMKTTNEWMVGDSI